MSLELPEIQIIAEQMRKELIGKQIKSCHLEDFQRLQKDGAFNKDIAEYQKLVDGNIESIISRGTVILVKFDNGMNLVLAPEYGGNILYHKNEETLPKKIHMRLDFSDNSMLTVRLKGWGALYAATDDELENLYVYRRDFSDIPSPIEDDFTFEKFSSLLDEGPKQIKAALVGKEAVVVGFGNSAFQDIIYRAKIHPKKKTDDLDAKQKKALYKATKQIVQERIQLGGKNKFLNLLGDQGGYLPVMGPNMKDQACPECGSAIEKLAVGGGHVYFCPSCQN